MGHTTAQRAVPGTHPVSGCSDSRRRTTSRPPTRACAASLQRAPSCHQRGPPAAATATAREGGWQGRDRERAVRHRWRRRRRRKGERRQGRRRIPEGIWLTQLRTTVSAFSDVARGAAAWRAWRRERRAFERRSSPGAPCCRVPDCCMLNVAEDELAKQQGLRELGLCVARGGSRDWLACSRVLLQRIRDRSDRNDVAGQPQTNGSAIQQRQAGQAGSTAHPSHRDCSLPPGASRHRLRSRPSSW